MFFHLYCENGHLSCNVLPVYSNTFYKLLMNLYHKLFQELKQDTSIGKIFQFFEDVLKLIESS